MTANFVSVSFESLAVIVFSLLFLVLIERTGHEDQQHLKEENVKPFTEM